MTSEYLERPLRSEAEMRDSIWNEMQEIRVKYRRLSWSPLAREYFTKRICVLRAQLAALGED